MKPHKWAKEIKAWAAGAEIESLNPVLNEWVIDNRPMWNNENFEFRIKPHPKEPQYLYVYKINGIVRLIETGGLIEVNHKDDHVIYIGKIKLETDDD